MSISIVTGSSLGLGFEVAKALATKSLTPERQDADKLIVVTSRSLDRANRAVEAIRNDPQVSTATKKPVLIPMAVDLSSFEAIHTFATQIKSELGSWDLLVNNAGAKVEKPAKTTQDGFEWHFGVNHLGHFLLTGLLFEFARPQAHVTCVSSITARRANSRVWSLSVDEQLSLPVGEQYASSKLANLVFALELNSRLKNLPGEMTANAAHPGFARAEPYGPKILRPIEYLAAQSAQSGAQPILAASERSVVHSASDVYFGPRIAELWGRATAVKLPETALPKLGPELWKLSEALTGRNWFD